MRERQSCASALGAISGGYIVVTGGGPFVETVEETAALTIRTVPKNCRTVRNRGKQKLSSVVIEPFWIIKPEPLAWLIRARHRAPITLNAHESLMTDLAIAQTGQMNVMASMDEVNFFKDFTPCLLGIEGLDGAAVWAPGWKMGKFGCARHEGRWIAVLCSDPSAFQAYFKSRKNCMGAVAELARMTNADRNEIQRILKEHGGAEMA